MLHSINASFPVRLLETELFLELFFGFVVTTNRHMEAYSKKPLFITLREICFWIYHVLAKVLPIAIRQRRGQRFLFHIPLKIQRNVEATPYELGFRSIHHRSDVFFCAKLSAGLSARLAGEWVGSPLMPYQRASPTSPPFYLCL